MQLIRQYFVELGREGFVRWNQFWFTPADPAALGLIRILAGAMILYSHAVWTLDLKDFFGPAAWLDRDLLALMNRTGWQLSYFWYVPSAVLPAVHIGGLIICLLFMIGLWTRWTSVLTAMVTLSYAHRVPEALYGLDQVNGFLILYLTVGPSGACYSVDRWISNRSSKTKTTCIGSSTSISANIATRLIQLQLCVMYLFAGLSKLQGEVWWDGTAFWGAVANLEYQSVDLTWLARFPLLVNVLTHVTVVWEISYIVLVWGRLSRPVVLSIAVVLHLGIGICLGMMTFGLAALIANLAFVSPKIIRMALDRSHSVQPPNDNGHAPNDNGHALTGPKWKQQSQRVRR